MDVRTNLQHEGGANEATTRNTFKEMISVVLDDMENAVEMLSNDVLPRIKWLAAHPEPKEIAATFGELISIDLARGVIEEARNELAQVNELAQLYELAGASD